ncbi:MAG: endopeptidase La [Oscillospiraceae bacterium]
MSEQIEIKEGRNNELLPCVAMRDLIVFPGMVMHFDVARTRSIKSLKNAAEGGHKIFLTAQKEITVDEPELQDLYRIGVIAEIKQIVRTQDGISRVLVEGLHKAKLLKLFVRDDKSLECEAKILPNYAKDALGENELTAVMREIKSGFEEYSKVMPRMPKELYTAVIGAKTPQALFEAITFNITMTIEDKQHLLELPAVGEKLWALMTILRKELDVILIERAIQEQVNEQIDQGQREYFLREQMKVIARELGEADEPLSENDDYMDKILAFALPAEAEEKLLAEAKRLSKMAPSSQEAVVIRGYLDTCLALPWNVSTKDRADIAKAQKILDKQHYGMKKVKDRILEILSVRALAPDIKGQIICLVGPPGVGKTSIGKSVAEALGRKYVRVSLGGVKDESDIRGHRKTYVGSMPGRIMNALKLAKSCNPVMLLDEIDKMSNDFRGDPSSAMLEVLDSEQNVAFRDHYLEIPFDLSDVLFITTANTLDTIQAPLLDRMEVIDLTSYTREEKFHIAKEHLIPKQRTKNGLKASQIRLADDAVYALIDSYTREAGVRKLERAIGTLCRKAAKEIVEHGTKKVVFTGDNLKEFLGTAKYLPDIYSKIDMVGVVNGLAWTAAGGVMMPLEVLVLDGKGQTELTGSLGDVMKESAKIAISYTRSIADIYGIDKEFYTKKDIHVHAPEGAVPKDGPSAGVTLTTALVSALSGIPVRSDVAMTGEITLLGKVLPIGGLREKTMAAYKAGIKTVVIPMGNKGDLDEVDEVIKSTIQFVLAENISDVLAAALVKPAPAVAAALPQKPRGRRKVIPSETLTDRA